MKKVTIHLYEFGELSEAIQGLILNKQRNINTKGTWWDSIYEGAKNIGLTITGFDLERGNRVTGIFNTSEYDTACLITNSEYQHGEECETYKAAKKFLATYSELEAKIGDDDNPFNPDVVESQELAEAFNKELLDLYLYMLKKEYEYQSSDTVIQETIEANGYTFEADGRMNNLPSQEEITGELTAKITSVSTQDLKSQGFDTSNVDQSMMDRLASKLANDYCEQLFWTSLEIIAEDLGIPKIVKEEEVSDGTGN